MFAREKTVIHVQKWLNETKLKKNPDEREFMYFGSSQELQKKPAFLTLSKCVVTGSRNQKM